MRELILVPVVTSCYSISIPGFFNFNIVRLCSFLYIPSLKNGTDKIFFFLNIIINLFLKDKKHNSP